jgi:hypothetical protein
MPIVLTFYYIPNLYRIISVAQGDFKLNTLPVGYAIKSNKLRASALYGKIIHYVTE